MTEDERRRTTCYLSGPMTGLPDFNYPLFHQAARSLRRQGYVIVNPAENHAGQQDLDRAAYFRTDLPQVSRCGVLLLLPGWQASRGVRWELVTADACGLRVFELEHGTVFYSDFFRGTMTQRIEWFPANRLSPATVRDWTRFERDPSTLTLRTS